MYVNISDKSKNQKENSSIWEMRHGIYKKLGLLKAHLSRLERDKDIYIAEARNAERLGDNFFYQSVKNKIRLCLINMKLISEMIVELEICLEVDSMDRLIEGYNSCFNNSKKKETFSFNFQNLVKKNKKEQSELENAIERYTEFYKLLRSKNDGVMCEDIISDDELERVIHNIPDGERDVDAINALIDEKLAQIKKRVREE